MKIFKFLKNTHYGQQLWVIKKQNLDKLFKIIKM